MISGLNCLLIKMIISIFSIMIFSELHQFLMWRQHYQRLQISLLIKRGCNYVKQSKWRIGYFDYSSADDFNGNYSYWIGQCKNSYSRYITNDIRNDCSKRI